MSLCAILAYSQYKSTAYARLLRDSQPVASKEDEIGGPPSPLSTRKPVRHLHEALTLRNDSPTLRLDLENSEGNCQFQIFSGSRLGPELTPPTAGCR